MSKKLDRAGRYTRFHMNARGAVLRVMNASEKARLAEALHPSRQAAHLDVADRELKAAVAALLDATVELNAMRKFRSYEERHPKEEKP